MKLVLFDIDGTILWTDGAGRRAISAALLEVFGDAGPDDHRFDGKTDPQIVREMMTYAGFDGEDIDRRLDALFARYLEMLEGELYDRNATRLLSGVPELLAELEARDDVVLGLLTGNLRRGAALKLAAAGLDVARFRVGAFGCDHADRAKLPAIALQRAHALLGVSLPGEAAVVIGDTPADMSCGRGIGARAVGVATGRYTAAELREHGASAVFETLSDTSAVLEAILSTERLTGAARRAG
jgi:phosphoglycolate phosphatase